MKIGIAWAKALLPVGFMLVAVATARAQYAPGAYPASGGGPVQPVFYDQGGYAQQGPDPNQPGMVPAPDYVDDPGMDYEVGPARDAHGVPYLGADRAFGTGGIAHPRWFDVSGDFLLFTRDRASRFVPLSSAGAGGPFVLSTNDLNFPTAAGFRFTGNYLIGAGRNLELTYFGGLNFSSAAGVTGVNGNLFSPFSNFGTTQTFAESDNADLHRISYSTNLNSGELNLRQRWTSPNGRVHSSLLTGVRYVKIVEDFQYVTNAGANTLSYRTHTSNDLVGFQVGGDVLTAIIPRLKFGAEAKAGIYGNDAQLRNTITSSPNAAGAPNLPDSANEASQRNNASFVGEAGGFMLVHVTPRLNLRVGYQCIVVTGIALAPESFNASPNFGTRPVILNDGGHALYHGGQMGFEWMW